MISNEDILKFLYFLFFIFFLFVHLINYILANFEKKKNFLDVLLTLQERTIIRGSCLFLTSVLN